MTKKFTEYRNYLAGLFWTLLTFSEHAKSALVYIPLLLEHCFYIRGWIFFIFLPFLAENIAMNILRPKRITFPVLNVLLAGIVLNSACLHQRYLIRRFVVSVSSLSFFTSCAVFWWARRVSQNTNNEWKLSAILHNKTSNKRFIIQHAKLLCPCGRISGRSRLEYKYRVIFVLSSGVR